MANVHNHHHHHECCNRPVHQPSLSDQTFKMLEKVSAVALGAFAAMADMGLFIPFFTAGAALGLYQYLSSTHREAHASSGSACSQGFLEQLTGVKLPPLISLGANMAITWCHIDHHSSVFVPVIALILGDWAGQLLGDLGSKISHVVRPEAV
jgi:hypothetical protein